MSWENTGNADTSPDSDFLGTTDQQPLVIRTNNLEALRVNADGKVGVGTPNPASKLEIIGDWKDGQEGALRLTGDKPSIKFAGGEISGNELWVLHLGSRGPGNLTFLKQAPVDPPGKFETVMTLCSRVNPAHSAVEIIGNWNDQEGTLRLVGDKPTLKFVGGGVSGDASWIVHLGSRGPGNLMFAKQGAGPNKWDTVMTLSHVANSGTPAVEINGDWNGNEGALKLTGDKPTIKFAGGAVAGNTTWVLHLGSRGPGNLEFMKQTGPGAFDHVLTLSPSANVGIGTSTPASKLDVVGDLSVSGDIRLTNADGAEEFDIADPHSAEPGTVMVFNEEGELRESHQAYDKRVAGVISGAGSYRPGIVLDKQASNPNRLALGLFGKVYCKVDARSSPIEVGDLLTTSCTPGHAMKASDSLRAFGAVIGKALRPLTSGQGLIPILIALQ